MSAVVESYVSLIYIGPSASGKSKVFQLQTQTGEALADVKWFGRWRCYAMFPLNGTIFEKRCLRDIANMLERESRAQLARKAAPARGPQAEKGAGG